MPGQPLTADVVICGAGIAGVATARALTVTHGVSDVLLVDPHPPLSQTSARSGENYRTWWPHPTMVRLITRLHDPAYVAALRSAEDRGEL